MNRELNLLTGSDVVQQHRRITKELPEIGVKLYEPTGSWFEGNKLETALEERYNLLKEPRIERDSSLSIAKWDPERKKVIVLKKKGKEWETYGHHDSIDNLDYLHPEEALFLIESNSLTLMHGDVEVSVEICYSLLLGAETGCSYEHYRVFSHLSRLGYKLIRNKKPDAKSAKNVESVLTNVTSTRNVPLNKNREETIHSAPPRDIGNNDSDEVVMIDDSSSDSSSNDDEDDDDDDVVIIDVIKAPKNKEIIDLDDNSRDSDIVMLDSPELIELPLEDWSYVHRDKFLYCEDDDKSHATRSSFLNPFLMSKPEYEICNEIPNIKGQRAWLYRPDDLFLPPGIFPFHFKYLIDLDVKNDNFRGRGGFRGRPRGRGWYMQRQFSQMKSYTISLMNMVTKLVGDRGMDMIPPPGTLFRGSNTFYRGGQRGPNQTWGRISFNKSTRGSLITSDTIELSDDEEPSTSKRSIKHEDEDEEDIKPNKKIKYEIDVGCIDSDDLIKTEPMDVKVEKNVKTESTNSAYKNSELSSITPNASVKTEEQGNTHCEGSCKEPALSVNKPASPSTSVSNCQNMESKTTPQSTVESLAPENILNDNSKTNLNTGCTLENNLNDASNSESNVNDPSNLKNNLNETSNPKNNPNDDSNPKSNPNDASNLNDASNPKNNSNDASNPIDASNPKNNLNDASNPNDSSNPKSNPNDASNSKNNPNDTSNLNDESNPNNNSNDDSNPKNDSNDASNLNDSNPNNNSNDASNPKNNPNDASNPKINPNDGTSLDHLESNIDSTLSSKNYDTKEDSDIVSKKGNDNEIKSVENIVETTKASSDEIKIDDTSSISDSHDDKSCENPSATSHISRPDSPDVITVDDDSLSTDINQECSNQTNSDDCTLIDSTNKDDCLDKNQDNNVPSSNVSISITDDVNQMEFETSDDNKKEDNSTECQQKSEFNRSNIKNSESIEIHCIDEQSNDNIETMSIDDDSDIVVDKISDTENSPNELDSSTVTNSCDAKTISWKQLKENDKMASFNDQKCGSTNEDQHLSDDDEGDDDMGTPLIRPHDCISMDNVLKRLQIFGEYKSQGLPKDSEEVNVAYDVYLPNTPYYRNLPPDPDFRLIILRFEDSYPNADQMIHLNGIYNDKKNFLFAILLKESIAYYLYNKVNLPVYNEM